MTLPPGARVGIYEIIAPLGAGGMGVVFRARDTRLDRDVALKLLPSAYANDPELRSRFEREARAASALNHAHIVVVFDCGTEDGQPYLAMELVDGVPFDAWARERRPTLNQRLDVVMQVADALATAHAAGIVHRDVKPGNILVSPQGYAKLVDFGIARQRVTAPPDQATMLGGGPVTSGGVLLGTAGYMAPEQILGDPADARSDVFALGVVLFEALAGRRPFARDTSIDELHAVVHAPAASLADVTPAVSPSLVWIVEKALAKHPDDRYQQARELAIDLRRARDEGTRPSTARDRAPGEAPPGRGRLIVRRIAWALAGLAALALVGTLGWLAARTGDGAAVAPLAGVRIDPLTRAAGYNGEPTISPDGQTIAYVTDRFGNYEIVMRQVAGGPEIQLTRDAADDVQPAYSPDGRRIAFVSSREGATPIIRLAPAAQGLIGGDIWTMAALGGSARRIARGGNFPSWTPDGASILYATNVWFDPHLMEVPADGGEPKEIQVQFSTPSTRGVFAFPRVSPDGQWIAFSNNDGVFIVGRRGGAATWIVAGADATWSRDGRVLVYTSTEPGLNNALWEVPIDPATGRAGGPASPLTVGDNAKRQPVVLGDGIVFASESRRFDIEVLPFDAETGHQTAAPERLTEGPLEAMFLSLSPDDRTVVFDVGGDGIYRVVRGGAVDQLTTTPAGAHDGLPRWSPDGRLIAFVRSTSGTAPARVVTSETRGAIWTMSPDGANPRPVVEKTGMNAMFTWMPDSSGIVYLGPDRQLHLQPLTGGPDRVLTNEKEMMPIAAVSPDGEWLVYQVIVDGNVDLHAVPMKGGASSVAVQTPGADYHPSFSPSGRWLYFQPDHRNVWRVPGPAQAWRQAPPEQVTRFPESGLWLEDPQVSFDGRALVYSRAHIESNLWLLRREAGTP